MPRDYLKVGDSWTASMPLAGNTQGLPPGLSVGNMAFAVKYEVEGFKRFAGRDCMVISVNGDLDGGDALKMPFFDDIRFDTRLKGVMFYDVSIGRLVKVAMDVDLDMGFAGAMGGMELDFDMELDIDLK
jgi:hypothetical protein